jgi:hypothetical protein
LAAFQRLKNRPQVKRQLVLAGMVLFVAAALVICLPSFSRYQSAACKQRGAAFEAKVERLKRDAQKNLGIGTNKDAVIRFFAENGIPVTFLGGEATGTISASGCAPAGCGSDNALLGLRVKVDKNGTVIAEPVIGALYTDCL